MKRLSSSRFAVGVVVLGALVAAVVAVASAQAAPSKKNYTVKVYVTNAADPQTFTVVVANEGSSNTTLGSVNITPPAGFTVDVASTAQSGWTAGVVGNVLQLRSTTSGDAITP